MAVLTRAQLLGATTVPQETVPIPELGGEVIVRGMTGKERDAFEDSLMEQRGRKRQVNTANIRAKVVAFCTVDTSGHRVFTDADVEQLGLVRADVVNRIFVVAQRLSGLSDQDVDELGKPSSQEDSPGSPSPSRASSA